MITSEMLTELYKKTRDQKLPEDQREKLLDDYRQLVDELPIQYIGPTWRKNAEGKWDLPASNRTLGWQIAGWCDEFVGGLKGAPKWRFTMEQLRFILWWYAIDDDGRFLYRTGTLQRCKGWGKDPLLAVLCLVEFVGPCRFGGWDANGDPIAIQAPDAWVQVAAVSRDQTKNTMRLMPVLVTDHMRSTYGIKSGAELWRAQEGTRFLEAVTSNPATVEGGRSTFICLNETHHWKSGNHGIEMYDTIEGNATKVEGRYLAITNAYLPDEDSVARRMRESYEDSLGRSFDFGILYDSVEADERAPLTPEAMEIILPKVQGGAWWLPIKDTIQSALAKSRSVARSRRMYYNQIVASEDALIKPHVWRASLHEDLELAPGDKIVLGFDGGKTEDATALVALRVSDFYAQALGIWEKPRGPEGDGWQINRTAVDSAVHAAFRKYHVIGFYADVAEWQSYIDSWHEKYGEGLLVKAQANGSAIAWDMRQGGGKPTYAHMRLLEAIIEHNLIKHNGEQDELGKMFGGHVLNARERENQYGMSFWKDTERQDKKIDAYAALVLAHECLHDYRTRRKLQTPSAGSEVWFF